ncbi:MAG: RNA polymerase sigma factor [Verrucomicrobia bacterium]|nr:RNA polymerase sigma factor [Verrucomicrobiota bacterium]
MASEQQPVSDEELARQAQAGSASGFEELVRRYENRIYRFVVNQCRTPADAQEVTQDAFVSAAAHLHNFDPARSFATWLFTIARRKCIDRQRANRRHLGVPNAAAADLMDADDPAELLARHEARQNLWRLARRVLPELQFQALWLRYAEDLSVADIARVLGKTSVHVKVLLFRARTVLARELEQPPGAEAVAAEVKRTAQRKLSAPTTGLTGMAPSSNL